jgi:flagellar operon protein
MAEKIDPSLFITRASVSTPATERQTPTRRPSPSEPDFATVLQAQQTTPTLRLSRHAEDRLRSREIHLNEVVWGKLEQAVAQADAKGAQQSLILLDDLALIVNITNRVVITALDKESRHSNVFTHIDSAVIV